MIVATWNINSINARAQHVKDWLEARKPDILLLQELKATEFPALVFRELGYESAAVTQKSYNGVAILSHEPIQVVSTNLAGDDADDHARFLETMIGGIRVVNIYLPNGNPVGSEKFIYKITWMNRLLKQMQAWLASGVPTVVAGDYNVIPEDIDCHKPSSWIHDALFQPEPRALFRAYLELGYIDSFRALHPDEKQFTFWDYFRKAFDYNRGIRIDHILLSPQLGPHLLRCEIDKSPRAREKPSDHAPIFVELS